MGVPVCREGLALVWRHHVELLARRADDVDAGEFPGRSRRPLISTMCAPSSASFAATGSGTAWISEHKRNNTRIHRRALESG
jgi:hypothetical protein